MSLCASHDEEMTPAEYEAIDVHKYYLSEKAGYDVGMEFAVADWLRNHSIEWRKRRSREDNHLQIQEIEKHKWIESKKAGRDLGDQAALDWVIKHAESWRRWRERCHRLAL